MLARVNKFIDNRSMFQDEEGNPVPIEALDVIFHELLEWVSNMNKMFIGVNIGIEEYYSI